MDALTLSSVSKSFGKQKVLDALTFSVPEHCIFGFVGQNGAGKTTTMKLICGLMTPDFGEITVCGERVRPGGNTTGRLIGYLPDVPEFYPFLTPMEYLTLCGRITGMKEGEIAGRAQDLMELVGLSGVKKQVKGFSRGMKQRLGIAQALMNRPRLLICDEPTSALDPVGRKEILDILKTVKEHTTVVFSTHILSDVERICDRVALLNGGKIALEGSMEEIYAACQRKGVEIEFRSAADAKRFSLLCPGGTFVRDEIMCYPSVGEAELPDLMGILATNRLSVCRLEILETSLEDLYLEVIGK